MDYLIGALAFIFILGTIIAIHEGGHFFFAVRAKILCREYAFGMGPILFKKKKGETLYTIRALPIGGFCAIAGETEEEDPFKDKENVRVKIEDGIITDFYFDNISDYPEYQIANYDLFDINDTGKLFMELIIDNQVTRFDVSRKAMIHFKKQEIQIAPHDRTLNAKTKTQRALTIFGGPLMNFILALVAFFFAGLITGAPDESKSKVSNITDGSFVYNAGLRDDDIITSLELEGIESSVQKVEKWNDISVFMDKYLTYDNDNKIIITYLRDGISYKTTSFKPTYYVYNLNMTSDPTKDGVVIGNIVKQNEKMMKNSELDSGDTILKINGISVESWAEASKIFMENENGEEMKLLIETKSNVQTTVTVMPFSKEIMDTQSTSSGDAIPTIKVAIGISPTYKTDFLYSLKYSGKMTVKSCTIIFQTFGLLFGSSKVGITELSGPVGIFNLLVEVAKQGFGSIFYWMGLLSVNVGILNLLPIPALDGGRLVFIAYEAITKKKPSEKVQTILIGATMILLLALMVIVSINDVIGLFK